MADAAASSSSPTTRCPGSSSASRASRHRDGRRRQRLDRRHRRFVRDRFPEVRLLERANRGLAAGWQNGLAETSAPLGAAAERRRVARRTMPSSGWSRSGRRHRDAAVDRRRSCSTRTAALQRSVRGFPTRWRLATEYLYLRKLGPRHGAPERVLRGGLRPRVRARGRMRDGRLHARPARGDRRGRDRPTPSFFLFSEEVDWCYRFAQAGWKTVFTPGGDVRPRRRRVARRRASTARTSAGICASSSSITAPQEAEQVRVAAPVSLVLRGELVRGQQGAMYRDAARWLGTGDVAAR